MASPSGDSRFISSRGAFNGTGIRANFDKGSSVMTVFYQHYTGDIRLIKVNWPSMSLIQSPQELIATDAKNGTSIGSTSITPPGLDQQHIFCMLLEFYKLSMKIADTACRRWQRWTTQATNHR